MHVWGRRAKENKAGRSEGHMLVLASQPSHIWATRAHNQQHMAGSKPITHMLQNQEGSRCMCGVGQNKKSRQVRGAHASIASQPSACIRATRAHNQQHMVGSKRVTHALQNQEASR